MRFPGGLCEFEDGSKYAALYNLQHDISCLPPKSLGNAQKILRFTYKRGNAKGGGDIFRLNRNPPRDLEGISLTKIIHERGQNYLIKDLTSTQRIGNKILKASDLSYAKEKCDIQFEVLADAPKDFQEQAMLFGELDIFYFVNGDFAENPRGSKIDHVEKIIPKTELKKIPYPKKGILDGGKQWFVPTCGLEANVDEGKGCAAAWIPGENSSFDGKIFTNFFWSPPSECEYCYADRKHKCPPKTIYKFNKEDEKRFLAELGGEARLNFDSDEIFGKPVKVLRFGKSVEPWMPKVTENSFLRKLELLKETKTKAVITTKFLPFRKDIKNILKGIPHTLFYSIGFDDVEKGACAWNCNNEWRFEQMIKYQEAKINAIPYLMINAHLPLGEREKRILDLGLRVQLLPTRYKKGKGNILVEKMTGETWNFLKQDSRENKIKINQFSLFEEKENFGRASYVSYAGELVSKKIHPDWLKLIGNNNGRIRMCHHNDELTYCGGCFQNKGRIVPTVHVEKKKNGSSKRN